LKEQGVDARTTVVVAMGNPAHAICQEAEDSGADLIVIGSRGLGRTGTLLMGSTSQQVLHCAKVPVLAVR
jgi:nucleotide-binding universal stress UspA family protein